MQADLPAEVLHVLSNVAKRKPTSSNETVVPIRASKQSKKLRVPPAPKPPTTQVREEGHT